MNAKSFNIKLLIYNHPIIVIIFVGFILRIIGTGFGLPYIYTADESIIVNRALLMSKGDLNPHWFNYPSLYIYIMFIYYGIVFIKLSLLGLVTGVQDFAIQFIQNPTSIYLSGRILTVIWGTIVIYLTYYFIKIFLNKRTALLGALFIAFNTQMIINSHYILTDQFSIILVLLTLIFSYRIYDSGKFNYYVLAGLTAGLGASTKYVPVLAFISVITAHLLFLYKLNNLKLRNLINKNIIVSTIMVIIGFIVGTPYSVLDYKTFLQYMEEWLIRGKYGRIDIPFKTLNGWFVVPFRFIPTAVGIMLSISIIPGIILLIKKHSKKHLIWSSFFIIYFILICKSKQITPRYPMLLYPIVALIAAYIIDKILLYFKYKRLYIFIVLTILIVQPAYNSLKFDITKTRKDTRTLAKEWIEKNIESKSKILVDGYGPQLSMTETQVDNLIKKAKEINHPKLYKLQLIKKTLPLKQYEWYQSKKTIYTALKRDLAWSESMMNLFRINQGYEKLVESGFEYVITTDIWMRTYNTEWGKRNYSDEWTFYQTIQKKGILIKEFIPVPFKNPGPVIKIYKISTR